MVNQRLFNKIKEEFRDQFGKIKNNNFKVLDENKKELDLIDKNESKENLIKLISCSENYFEDLTKIFIDIEKVLIINTNQKLYLKGSGLLYLIIKEDTNLELIFNSENNIFETKFIKILINENKKLNLKINFQKEKTENKDNNNDNNTDNISFRNNNWVNFQIILEKESTCKLENNIESLRESIFNIRLYEKSNFESKTIYYLDNENTFLRQNIYHVGNKSISNTKIKGVVKNNTKLINDVLIKINKNSYNCEGYQDIRNIIFDNTSKVYSEPILEIENNEVKCSHSCSILKLKPEEIYYFKSRGLNQNKALDLIVENLKNNI
jgi:hypothetical protein